MWDTDLAVIHTVSKKDLRVALGKRHSTGAGRGSLGLGWRGQAGRSFSVKLGRETAQVWPQGPVDASP